MAEVTSERFLAASPGAGFFNAVPHVATPAASSFPRIGARPAWTIFIEPRPWLSLSVNRPRLSFGLYRPSVNVWTAISNFSPDVYSSQPFDWLQHPGPWSSHIGTEPKTSQLFATREASVTWGSSGTLTVQGSSWAEDDDGQSTVTTLNVRSPAREPAWLALTESRLQHLLNLAPGWDSYGADVISPQAAQRTLDFLWRVLRSEDRPPEIVPSSDGGLQLEWHTATADLEVEIPPSGELSVWYRDEQANAQIEFECLLDGPGFERLVRLYEVVEEPIGNAA